MPPENPRNLPRSKPQVRKTFTLFVILVIQLTQNTLIDAAVKTVSIPRVQHGQISKTSAGGSSRLAAGNNSIGLSTSSLRGIGLGLKTSQEQNDFEVDSESMQAIMSGAGISDDHLRRTTGFAQATSGFRPSYGASLRRLTASTTAGKPYVRTLFPCSGVVVDSLFLILPV